MIYKEPKDRTTYTKKNQRTSIHDNYYQIETFAMSAKDTLSLGILLLTGGIYYGFHSLWLVLFTLITLVGCIGIMKKEKTTHEEKEKPCDMSCINPFDSSRHH